MNTQYLSKKLHYLINPNMESKKKKKLSKLTYFFVLPAFSELHASCDNILLLLYAWQELCYWRWFIHNFSSIWTYKRKF